MERIFLIIKSRIRKIVADLTSTYTKIITRLLAVDSQYPVASKLTDTCCMLFAIVSFLYYVSRYITDFNPKYAICMVAVTAYMWFVKRPSGGRFLSAISNIFRLFY